MSTGLGAESDRGYESYRAGTCSVHGTLKRHISSGIDTTMEEDVFDDYSDSKVNGGPAFPFITADMMLKGRHERSVSSRNLTRVAKGCYKINKFGLAKSKNMII